MPSAYGRKRRISLPRRSKLKNRKPQAIRKKLNFNRGRQANCKSVKNHRKSSPKKPISRSLNDSKTLRDLRKRNMYMTTKAKGIVASFMKKLYQWVSAEAERLRRERNRPSIGFIEMRSALERVFPRKCTCGENYPKSGGSRHMKIC